MAALSAEGNVGVYPERGLRRRRTVQGPVSIAGIRGAPERIGRIIRHEVAAYRGLFFQTDVLQRITHPKPLLHVPIFRPITRVSNGKRKSQVPEFWSS